MPTTRTNKMRTKKSSRTVRWFARCTGIARMGPFSSQLVAWENLKQTNGEPAPGATVWCER